MNKPTQINMRQRKISMTTPSKWKGEMNIPIRLRLAEFVWTHVNEDSDIYLHRAASGAYHLQNTVFRVIYAHANVAFMCFFLRFLRLETELKKWMSKPLNLPLCRRWYNYHNCRYHKKLLGRDEELCESSKAQMCKHIYFPKFMKTFICIVQFYELSSVISYAFNSHL